MFVNKTPLVLFAGPGGESSIEALVDGACQAALFDLIDDARASAAFEPIILVTDEESIRERVGPDVILETGGADFHFGRRLSGVVAKHELESVMVAGAGNGPLLRGAGLAAFPAALAGIDNAVVANNLFSADIVAFTPAEALGAIKLPARDNFLPQALWRGAGLESIELPRTPATQFDIDTPIDLTVLSMHSGVGPHLRSYLDSAGLDTSAVEGVGRLLTDPTAMVTVAGRVGSHAWAYLERETACKVRLLSEERGMESDGRAERGEARSVLGFYLEEVGLPGLFRMLAELGDAAILDVRVLLAHMKLSPSREDRFLADVGQSDQIQDAFLRELTEEAGRASIPILVGGHSLVSGGLMALTDAAWLREDAEKAAGR